MSGLAASWYRTSPLRFVLAPLAVLYGAVTALRRAAYRTGWRRASRVRVPVIVVGNLTAGGTGKTPLTLWLADWLLRAGHQPGIVSRGHGGSSDAPGDVEAGMDPAVSGDEPVLLARRSGVPVWTGRRRYDAAAALLQVHPDCDVIVCDDGLQHYALARDMEIAVVDGGRGFGNGWLLPAGPLREGADRLRSVTAVVVNGEPGAALRGTIESAGRPWFVMQLRGNVFIRVDDPEQRATAADLAGRPLHAVAGIGNPDRFFQHLRDLGLTFTPHPFPDHHVYSREDLAWPGAILMTEKDAVKCRGLAPPDSWALAVSAHVEPAFGDLVLRTIRKIHGPQTA